MNIAIILFMAFSVGASRPPPKYSHRMNKEAYKKAIKYEPLFTKYSELYNVPRWLMYGIAMQESNISPGAKSHTSDYGIMQVHCSKTGWSWLPFLMGVSNPKSKWYRYNKYLKGSFKVKSCKDLLKPEISIHASAIILRYMIDYERRYGYKNLLLRVVTTYNKGSWRKYKNPTMAKTYHRNVLWFGEKIERCLEDNDCVSKYSSKK